jgi:hypothetical protein
MTKNTKFGELFESTFEKHKKLLQLNENSEAENEFHSAFNQVNPTYKTKIQLKVSKQIPSLGVGVFGLCIIIILCYKHGKNRKGLKENEVYFKAWGNC